MNERNEMNKIQCNEQIWRNKEFQLQVT
jgi:hypothetical protein